MTKLAPPKFVYVFMMLLIDFTLNFAPSNKVNAVFVNFDCCANFATQSVFGLQNKLNIGVNRNFYGGHQDIAEIKNSSTKHLRLSVMPVWSNTI